MGAGKKYQRQPGRWNHPFSLWSRAHADQHWEPEWSFGCGMWNQPHSGAHGQWNGVDSWPEFQRGTWQWKHDQSAQGGAGFDGQRAVDRRDGACGGGLPHIGAERFRRGVGLGLQCRRPVGQQFDSEFDPCRQGSRFVRNRCDCGGREVFLCGQK